MDVAYDTWNAKVKFQESLKPQNYATPVGME